MSHLQFATWSGGKASLQSRSPWVTSTHSWESIVNRPAADCEPWNRSPWSRWNHGPVVNSGCECARSSMIPTGENSAVRSRGPSG
jgi:hypothetical protein